MAQEQRNHLWKWVAFGLFSRYASHRMKLIELGDQYIDMENVAAFRTALQRPETMFEVSNLINRETTKSFEKILASHFMLNPPPYPFVPVGLENHVEFAPQVVIASQGSVQDEWRSVVLPGCGPAWIHRTWGTTVSKATEECSNALLPHLAINDMNEQSKSAVLELLQLVGQGIQKLSIINSSTQDLLDDWVYSVLLACPCLKGFAVAGGGRITSMDLFARMYEEFSCRVQSLRLERVDIDDSESVLRFMRSMGDDTLMMSKTLHKLTLELERVEAPLKKDLLPIMDTSLSSNVQFQKLDTAVTFMHRIGPALTSVRQKHNGIRVAVRAGPLSLSQKLAFCSTLATGQSNDSNLQHVMQRLDHRVVSLIFEFAANCKKRKVSVWFRTDQDVEDNDDEPEVQGDLNDQADQ